MGQGNIHIKVNNHPIIKYHSVSTHLKNSEFNSKNILKFLFVLVDQLFQLSNGVPMGTNRALLLTDLFLYSYDVEFIQMLLHEEIKPFVVASNSAFKYNGNILSINNDESHS
jgi:hypothetical protein